MAIRARGAALGAVCVLFLASCTALSFQSVVGFAGPSEESKQFVVGLAESADDAAPSTPHRTMYMTSANGTRYRCFLPVEAEAGSGPALASSTDVTEAPQASLAPQRKPTELLEALGEHCYYYYDDWWTYELCYKKHVRQYHKGSDGQLESEYLLGVYDELEQPEDEDAVQVDVADVSGRMPYVSQLYSGGESCELTQEQRQAEVRFTCGGDGGGTRLASIKEPSSCRYVLTVATPRLCKHAAFQEQPTAATLIRCQPLPESEQPGAAVAGQCSSAGGPAGATPAGSTCAAPDAAARGAAGRTSGGGAAAAVDDGDLVDDVTALDGEDEAYDEDSEALLQQLVEGEFAEEDGYDDEGDAADDPNATV